MPHARTFGRTVGLVAVVALLTIGMAAPPVMAQSAEQPAFIVALNSNGSAEITLRLTFDLTTEDERQAFETLQNDEQARHDARDRFRDRMRVVAAEAANATGREMAVTDARIDLRQAADGSTGVVAVTVSWAGLAAVDDGTLVVTEPFASGFSPDRPFVLHAPEGYELASASPAPDERNRTSATWQADTELTGFSAEIEPTASPTSGDEADTATTGQPGFGAIAALLGILLAAGGRLGRSRSSRGS